MILDNENILIEDLKNNVKWPSLIEHHFNSHDTYPSFEAYVNSLTQLIKHLNDTCKIANGTWYATRSDKIIFAYDWGGDELLKFEYNLSPMGNSLEVILYTCGDILKRYNVSNEYLQDIVNLLATQPGYKIVSNNSYRIIYSKFC